MDERELRRFIISRFIWTSVIVAVVEFVLIFALLNMILPLLIDQFFSYVLSITSIQEFWHLPPKAKWALLGTAVGVLALSAFPLAAGAVFFSGQITRKLKVYEQEREAERDEEQKKRYLMISDIAHDLKTPMTTVAGYARALSDGMVKDADRQEYLNAIEDKTLRMNDIVQMLFNYVRLDSDGFNLTKGATDLCELVRESVAGVYRDIEDAKDEVEVDIPDEAIMLEADKVQLARVINNLLTNAVKHNPEGTVIGVTVREEPDEVRLYIADSGDVIPQELADRLFEPFVMGDESRSSGGGSGLGLAVASKIAQLHGYRLKLVQRPEMQRYCLGDRYNKVFLMIVKKPVE